MRCTRTATRRTPGPARARAASPDSRTTTRPHSPGTARPRTVARRAPAARPSRCRAARVTRPRRAAKTAGGPGLGRRSRAGRTHGPTGRRGARQGLGAGPVRAVGERVVLPPRRPGEPRGGVLVFGDEPPVLAHLHVRAGLVAPIVARGAIGVEADQPGKPAGAAVHLVDDLFVVDAFQQLARQSHARRLAALPQLVEKAVRDQLQTFFDQLVVNLALLLDLVWGLEPGGKAGLELAKADVVEAGGVS